jgi:hypothetical protein
MVSEIYDCLTESEFLTSSDSEHKISVYTKSKLTTGNEKTTMLSADVKDSVAFQIGHSVPEVQAVFTTLKGNRLLHVWAVVPQYDRAVYRSIYAREKEIIGQFGALDFDFNVIPSNGRNPRDIISDPTVELAFLRS